MPAMTGDAGILHLMPMRRSSSSRCRKLGVFQLGKLGPFLARQPFAFHFGIYSEIPLPT